MLQDWMIRKWNEGKENTTTTNNKLKFSGDECKMMLVKGNNSPFIEEIMTSKLSWHGKDALALWKVAPHKC